jgi:hypothetical protein
VPPGRCRAGGAERVRAAQGQPDGERGPGSFLAPHRDRAAVRGDDVLGDGQAQAGPAGGPGPGRIHPVEPLEDALEVALGDADALIGDADLGRVRPGAPGGDEDPGLLRAVGDRVLQQVPQGGDHEVLVAVDGHAGLAARRQLDAVRSRAQPAAVQGLGHHGVDAERRRVGHRLGGLDPGQHDQVLDQVGQPGGFLAHPPGEAQDRLRVVRGVLHRLGQQGQCADRGLQLMADVGDEVPADLVHPAALGLVLGKQEHEPVLGRGRAEQPDPDREAGGPPVEPAGGQVNLALADLPVAPDLAGQGDQLADHEAVTVHQPERAGGGAGPQHPVVTVQDDGRRGEHREHGVNPRGQARRRRIDRHVHMLHRMRGTANPHARSRADQGFFAQCSLSGRQQSTQEPSARNLAARRSGHI